MIPSADVGAMTRVVAVATTLPAAAGDGTPDFVWSMAAHLPACTTTIVAPRSHGCAVRQRFGAVEVRRFPYASPRRERLADEAILPALRARPTLALQVPGLLLGLWRTTRTTVRDSGADVIHAHWILPAGLVAWLHWRRTGVPYVITAHGADAYALRGRIGRSLKRLVLRGAAGVHAVSSEIASTLEDLVPGCVSLVSPVGVDVAAMDAGATGREPVPGRVLFVGRLAPKKGVDVLVDAMAALPAEVHLDIIGDGPDRAHLERRAITLGLTDRVRFLGARPRADVVRALAQASVVAIPSRTARNGDRDGTPVVVLEAMAAGAPIVASALGGIAEVVRDGADGLLVPEGDADALALALTRALREPAEAAARARSARDRIVEFDCRVVGERVGALLTVASRR